MSGFAPGPWVTDPELGHEMVLDANGVLVADCSIVHRRRTTSQCVAHAALMAAALEMFVALRECEAELEYVRRHGRAESGSNVIAALAAARTALAKAQGVQP